MQTIELLSGQGAVLQPVIFILIGFLSRDLFYHFRRRIRDRRTLRHSSGESGGPDTLTRLPGRQAFYDYLESSVAVASREGFGVGLLYLDLDHFKEVNETYGHRVGDRIIASAVRRLQGELRRGDRLFRTGGDEFILLVQGVDDVTAAAMVAEKLLGTMRSRFILGELQLYVAASIGIAWYPGDAVEPAELIRKADVALAEAKRDRNTYRFYTKQLQSTAAHHVAIVNALRAGLEGGEFYLAFQPIMGKGKQIIGAEALLRWETAEFENLSPEVFIPVAESSGVIQEVGSWVLREAAAKRAALAGSGFVGFLSVNVSAHQLRNPRFIEEVRGVIDAYRLEPGSLHFELTETSLMSTEGVTVDVLLALRELGVTLAIDDFGKGYSSLSYLRHLPVQVLKIDRSFILGMIESAEDRSIIESISSLAKGLGLEVVAEGVETALHFECARSSNCNAFQGYHFSRPVPFDAFLALLTEG
ncbi:MAG: putative bifunctional diguanylate cyclase/phosphodiesterase [Alkalispirochaetaceae bacterium]